MHIAQAPKSTQKHANSRTHCNLEYTYINTSIYKHAYRQNPTSKMAIALLELRVPLSWVFNSLFL